MLASFDGSITVLAAVITIRDLGIPSAVTIALSILCFAIVGIILRGELRRKRSSDV
jgi:hypothetical protein